MSRSSFLLTGVLLAGMIGLGAADALLVEGIPAAPQSAEDRTAEDRTRGGVLSSSASSLSSLASLSSASSGSFGSSDSFGSSPSFPSFPSSSISPVDVTPPPTTPSVPSSLPPGAVKKRADIDVLRTAAALGFDAQDTEEKAFLSAVVQGGQAVTARTLLMDGDRAGLLVWIETPLVKQVFMVLKESLHSLFSAEVRDLLDETQSLPGKPVRNFLTFFDPGLSEERLVFVRVRERLYEFHIAPGKEDAMYKLVEAMTE